jgi:hypothetical protein
MGIRLKLKARQRQREARDMQCKYAYPISFNLLNSPFSFILIFSATPLHSLLSTYRPTDAQDERHTALCYTNRERTLKDHNKAYHNITISVALSLVRVSSRCRQPGPVRPASGPPRPIPRHLGHINLQSASCSRATLHKPSVKTQQPVIARRSVSNSRLFL